MSNVSNKVNNEAKGGELGANRDKMINEEALKQMKAMENEIRSLKKRLEREENDNKQLTKQLEQHLLEKGQIKTAQVIIIIIMLAMINIDKS